MTPEEKTQAAGEFTAALAATAPTGARYLSAEELTRLAEAAPLADLSLYNIEREMLELIDAREQAEAEGELPETLAVIDRQIRAYFTAEVRKVDGIARYINHCKVQAAVAKAEAERLSTWARRWENRLERVKAATVYALAAVGLKKVESAENRLRLQKNPASVEVYDVAALPDKYQSITIKMPVAAWLALKAVGSPDLPWDAISVGPREVDKRAIADALKRRVSCPECGNEHHPLGTCPTCDGKGTLPAAVPGARWAAETEHLRVE
jgi:hypothetical protein